MISPTIQKSFFFLALITFFVALVESAPTNCPPAPTNGILKTYVIVLNTTSTAAAQEHYNMLETCFQKKVLNSSEPRNSINDDQIWDFSINEHITGYVGKFFDSFVEGYISTRDDVYMWKADMSISIGDAMVANETGYVETLITESTRLKYLDRIDQETFPLDGKYTYPASAGRGVNVYVVDTGININHVDFGGRAKFGAVFCDGCPSQDDNGHGTMVSGIIGGKFYGVAKETNLIAVKVLNATGTGSLVSIIGGLNYVLEQHLASTNKKTVINMSLGFYVKVPLVDYIVSLLAKAGIHVVVAANNGFVDACNISPASAPEAITVGATELDNDSITSFSNWGPCVDIFAPGRNIESAFGENSERTGSGTSFSSPQVAGTVALILSENDKYLSPAQVTEELLRISTKNVVKGIEVLAQTPNRFLRVPNKSYKR